MAPVDKVDDFLWRDKKGNFHDPKSMDTSYLFNTIKMLWNHSVPIELRVYPYIKYTFGGYYTRIYLMRAAKVMSAELSTRTDMSQDQIDVVRKIRTHIDMNGKLLFLTES